MKPRNTQNDPIVGTDPATSNPSARPSEAEAREILIVARLAALGRGATSSDADDVSQIVAMKFTEKWQEAHLVDARNRDTNHWHAYIASASHNAYSDKGRRDMRANKRDKKATLETNGDPLHTRPGVHRRRAKDASDVERYLSRLTIIDLIDEACETERQREIAALHFINGLTVREIAEKLGLSVRTVNQHKRAAVDLILVAFGHNDER